MLPQLHKTLQPRLVQHISSETWNCCPNWTCHSSFGLPLAATTAILTQQIGLPLGFWQIAPSQIHWMLFIQSVPAGEVQPDITRLFFHYKQMSWIQFCPKLLPKTPSTIFTAIPVVIHGIISTFHSNIQPFSNDKHVLFMTEGHEAHLPKTAYFFSHYYLHFLPQHSPHCASYWEKMHHGLGHLPAQRLAWWKLFYQAAQCFLEQHL